MKKALVYVRVSSKEQEQGFSIPAQKRLLQDYARDHDITVVAVFEEAESAKIAGRTKFREMLNYLNANKDIKHILVEKTDRLYRNIADYNDLNFEELSLQIHLVKEGGILSRESRSHEKFIHGIKVLMAKNYSDNLSEEASKGLLEKARQGLWPSCAPLGYQNHPQSEVIIPDPGNAHLITKAFELAATGQYSIAKLSQRLFDMGLKSKRAGHRLGKAAMSRVLKNPIYHGKFQWNGVTYDGKHQALVSKSLFDKTQEAMGFIVKPQLTKRTFTYTGLMTCAHCGCAITAQIKRKKSGKTYTYYNCTNGKGTCKDVQYVPERIVEVAFTEALQQIRLSEDIVEWTRTALFESHQDERKFREASLVALGSRYQALQRKVDMAYEDKLDRKIPVELWESKSAQWKKEQEEIGLFSVDGGMLSVKENGT